MHLAAALFLTASAGAPAFADPSQPTAAQAPAGAASAAPARAGISAPAPTGASAVPASGGPTTGAASPAIAAGAHLRFHLSQPLGSNLNRAGDTFSFVLLQPIVVDGRVLEPQGAVGAGTVLLAGKSGTSGHEGDLTLRLDSVNSSAGSTILFADQRIEINGRNRKVMSGVLGFVPFAGLGALFIHGSEMHIDPATPIETVLLHPASPALTTASGPPGS